MGFIRGRYSKFIRPFLMAYDVFVINVFAYYVFKFNAANIYFFKVQFLNNKQLLFFLYAFVFWFLSALLTKFYKTYRYTSALSTLTVLFQQLFCFAIIVFAFIGLFRSLSPSALTTISYIGYCVIAISTMKLATYYSLKLFRSKLKGNNRQIIVIGDNINTYNLIKFFNNNKTLGYKLKATFSKNKDTNFFNTCVQYIRKHLEIDEIYCSISELKEAQINTLVTIATNNNINIKFIPKAESLLSKRLKTEYYSYFPVQSLPVVALNTDFNRILKRSFDIIFSLCVCVFILSWLSVLLYLIIKIESKGPLFFKHKRTGIHFKPYTCFKYRSLTTTTENKDTYVSKNDHRVTKVGKFLRKTSLDELPQFYNVLIGDMSIVGPRPHMLTYTDSYSKIIDKYNFVFRHNVKPGITGLAQIKGFRGEIKNNSDIINRIKYDIYYIDNWSILLDIQIILKTTISIIKGDENAY